MSPRSGSPRRGAGGWLLIVCATAAALFSAWLVVRTSVASALAKRNPAAAAMVAPGDPRIPLARAMREFTARGGVVTTPTKQAALGALREAPLAGEPFLFAAVDALMQEDGARAERLLVEARRRNPRERITRLLLLDTYLRRKDIVEATREISALGHLLPAEARGLLIGELARLAQLPETRDALEGALKKNPAVRDPLLEHLAAARADPELILRLHRNLPAPQGAGAAPWQAQLIASLVERGQTGRAYNLWRDFSAPQAPDPKSGIYDGGFQGLPGSAPFNWQFPATPHGVAERTAPRTLQIEYYGRNTAELASQLLMLSPGGYGLSVQASGDAEGVGSKLSWKLECLPSKAEIADLGLSKLSYAPKVLAANFTVPASGCSSQWLRLVGIAGEFPKSQNAVISAVHIKAAP